MEDLVFAIHRLLLAPHSQHPTLLLEAPTKNSLVGFGAWKAIQPELNLNAASLANLELLDSVEPEDIDPAWAKQSWWQAQVDTQLKVHFTLSAPERL